MNLLFAEDFYLIGRYIVFGLWNSIFGWLIFTAVWKTGHDHFPLWSLVILAHLVATTQAFITQRKWVFRSGSEKILIQYARFQGVFLGLLGAGLLMLQALVVQGMHPLLAQILVMAAQAASGFVLGQSFTFSPEKIRLRYMFTRLVRCAQSSRWVWVTFGVNLAVFQHYLVQPFYASLTNAGHDFALTGPALLEGRYWLQTNGFIAGLFNPPWFTPAWCAGTVFFADPQNVFYSPLQWLTLAFDPFQAVAMNALLFAAAAYWGCYFLARRILHWQPAAAAVFAVLGMANAFLPMRSAVGDADCQSLYLWPWIALALCWPSPAPARWLGHIAAPALGVALGLTGWLHFGFAEMMAPTFLAVLLLCLVLVFMGRQSLRLVAARAVLGGALAIALNSSKLYEAASLMHNFPRDFYGLPGFASLRDALIAPLMALLLPSEWTALFGAQRLSNVRFAVLPHEWAMEFGLGALAVALLAAMALLWLRLRVQPALAESANTDAQTQPRRGTQWLALLGCALIGILVPLLLWNQGPV
ncbi:MAG: GtrA family protein, partial [Betaproteobacteria bacterium]|nr:GtrA family protein [Betaproteobacteria bacterium]